MPTFLISWFDTAEFLCEQNVYKIVCGCMCMQGVKKIFIEKKIITSNSRQPVSKKSVVCSKK